MIDDMVSYQTTKYSERKVLAAKWLADRKELTQYAASEELRMGSIGSTRDVQILESAHPVYKAKVSVTNGHYSNVHTGYIEVTVNASSLESDCPCKYRNEVGLNCPHVKAVLFRLPVIGLGKQWVDRRFYAVTYQASYGADIPSMAVAGKLQANEYFCPPDYKRPAGRPTKQRKERSQLRTTNTKRECKACGELGHFAVSCVNPSTSYRYYKHKNKALQWCKARESVLIDEAVVNDS